MPRVQKSVGRSYSLYCMIASNASEGKIRGIRAQLLVESRQYWKTMQVWYASDHVQKENHMCKHECYLNLTSIIEYAKGRSFFGAPRASGTSCNAARCYSRSRGIEARNRPSSWWTSHPDIELGLSLHRCLVCRTRQLVSSQARAWCRTELP